MSDARTADLKSYLPDWSLGWPELTGAQDAAEPEINALWSAWSSALRNQFITTADGDGLARFEGMAGLAPSGSLERRRAAVLDAWNDSEPYTLPSLKRRLDALCGAGRWDLDVSRFGQYEIKLTLLPPINCGIDRVADLFDYEYMLPCNLVRTLAGTFTSEATAGVTVALSSSMTALRSVDCTDPAGLAGACLSRPFLTIVGWSEQVMDPVGQEDQEE